MTAPQRSAVSATIAEAALAYAARGWSVIPIQAHGKRPLVVWCEFQQRIASAGEIDRWFRHWPDANVGIVTGRISGIVVVDVDAQHGGPDSVAEVEAATGGGGGGRHLYFEHSGTTVANRVAIRPGIDVRGDGGCVVAPPPVHFFEPPGLMRPIGHSRLHWRQLIREGIGEGQRNNTIASLTGHLLWRGVDLDVVFELMLAWNRTHCRPRLPDDEVVHVVQSIARTQGRDPSGPS